MSPKKRPRQFWQIRQFSYFCAQQKQTGESCLPLNFHLSIFNSISAFQRESAGTGATMLTGCFDTGWINSALRECRLMPPSGLERGKPYFKSPLMGHPIFAN